MPLLALPFEYLDWHYRQAWRDLARISRDWLWFSANFFSITLLTRTLFSPWRRLGESYPAHFNPAGFLATLIVNLLMRLVGIVIRLIMLFFGLIIWLASLILIIAFFLIWSLLPFLIILSLLFGFKLLLS